MTMQRYQSASGAVLRAARALAGMTQADLAKAANLHPKSVAYWERKGSRGRYGEVGFGRILDALRAHGVIVVTGAGEGAVRAAPPPATLDAASDKELTDEGRLSSWV